MTLENAFKIIKRYTVQSLIVVAICTPMAFYLFKEYKELQVMKDEHNKEVHAFYAKAALLEKEIIQKQGENFKQQIYIEQIKKEYEIKLTELESIKKNINAEYARLADKEKMLTASNQKHLASEKLQAMMSEFSRIGVDLSRSPKCQDSEEKWQRYNMAKAKLNEASTYAQANGLYDAYKGFFVSNATFMVSSCG